MRTDATSSLCRDFMLTVYLDAQGRVPGHRTGLEFGLSGAMLMELALDGCIDTVDGYVVAAHGARSHDPVLDGVLVRIRSSRKPRTASEWVRVLSVGAHKRLSAGLIAEGVLVRTPRRMPLPTGRARRYDVPRGERRDVVLRSRGGAAGSSEGFVALAALSRACGVASGGREWTGSEATPRSVSPACARILTAVADCIWVVAFSSWP